jgi:hypothetical protein
VIVALSGREFDMDLTWSGGIESTFDLRTLVAIIEQSPIRFEAPESRLPAGFDGVDIAILDWIADQARASRRAYVWM